MSVVGVDGSQRRHIICYLNEHKVLLQVVLNVVSKPGNAPQTMN